MNIRWFALVLMITLIPGCSGRIIETAPSEALYETKPTETVGFSLFSDIPETGGAIQALPLYIRDAVGFRFLGDDILVFSGHKNTTLTLLDGHTFAVRAEISLPLKISPEDPDVTVTPEGVTYMDKAKHRLVFLDTLLEEVKSIPLPMDCSGAVLSSDRQLLYCCTADSLRVMDLHSGTDRPVREMCFPDQSLTALHCDGSVLQCAVTYPDGTTRTLFLSAEDGRLLYESEEAMPLWTHGDLYFAVHTDGAYRELISGSPDFGPSLLVTETEPIAITPVLSQHLILFHSLTADSCTLLDSYHLETGIHTSQATLPEQYEILDIRPDSQDETLWLLSYDRDADRYALLYWDISKSDPKDPQNYIQPRWDPENPDWEGLAQCEDLAAALSEKHGVRILLRTDAVETGTAEHKLLPEYRVPLIRSRLQELDAALSKYPEGFLEELAVPTGSDRMNICLVQSIEHDAVSASLLHWDSHNHVWLILSSEHDLTRQLHRHLSDLIDCRVLGISDAYDGWKQTCPDRNCHLDRIQILEAAMLDGQESSFTSGFMQSQLRQLCLGIRETFRSAKAADTLPWEQYIRNDP